MQFEQVTNGPTEADLEAEIHHALRTAFPWIPAGDLRHQTTFSLRLGRQTIEVDGLKELRAQGRADLIVHNGKDPLAVLELKRSGKAVTQDDRDQGLSYARLFHPRPPLVVVSNGSDTRLFQTDSGERWEPADSSATALERLIENAARVAAADTKKAVEILLGTGSDVWVKAVRQGSAQSLDDLTGAWDQPLLPFVRDFLIPRAATQRVIAALQSEKRIVMVAGPPLSGKSNVLRELVNVTADSAEFAVLFIEADGGAGHGVFQLLANVLASTLDWPVTRDEAREWLRGLSRTRGAALVLAIDGVGVENAQLRQDLEELASGTYGNNLRVVISLDDTAAQRLARTANGLSSSAIGRAAAGIGVGPFDDAEFAFALEALWERRVGFVPGVQSAAEMRTPWVLRAVVAEIEHEPGRSDEAMTAILPSLLGLSLFAYARERFREPDLIRRMQAVARAVLTDSADEGRAIGLILESVGVYMTRDRTLESEIGRPEIDALIAGGVLSPAIHESGEPVLVARLPELLGSELAVLLKREIVVRARRDVEDAASWLVETAQNLPLGDLVGAQALYDAAQEGGVSVAFITALVNRPPRTEPLRPGTRFAMSLQGSVFEMNVREDRSLTAVVGGRQHVVPPDEENDPGAIIADMHPWLILSHLASQPMVMQSADGGIGDRLDSMLLLELGSCREVLRGPQNNPELYGVLTHDLGTSGSVVCHEAGIVEPVTSAMYLFLGRTREDATGWVEEAASSGLQPLLMRVRIALLQLVGSTEKDKSSWAQKMIEELIDPALENSALLH